ncbi:MAG TPA: 7TM-DISM domain-containing protein, partial [Leptospiraceae bacterium]|nr:7TM-DISM domain-containing protein [Leptospiraceae bacterium]
YWEKFISPSSVGGEKIQPSLIQVPLQWQKQKILLNGQQFQIPRFGYASCRLKIIFPDKADKLTLYSSGVSSSYEIYADGELILRSGKKGISLEETEPFSRRKILPLKTEGKRETDIVIHVSNYHDFSMFGIWDRMVLDRPESAVRSYIFKSWETFILFSSLAVMGIYHIVLYLNRKHDRSPLYFGLFCILMAIREMSIYDKVIIDLFPSIPYWLVHKFEFIPFYAGGILFTMFIQSLFPEEFPSLAFKLILTAGAVPIFLLIFFPMHIYTYTRGFYQILSLFSLMVFIYASSRAIYRRKEGAGLFVAAVSVFLMTMVHDVLKARGVVHTPAMNGF